MNIGSLKQAIQGTTALRRAEWIPMTAARILIGVFFCISGGTKLWVPAEFRLIERTMVELIFSGPGRYSIDGWFLSTSRRGKAE